MSTLIFYLKMVAVVFWVFYTSVLYLFIAVFSPRRNNLFAKVVNHLANGILPILGLKLEIEGKENLTLVHPCVFIGNHQSALDVVIYGALCPPNTVAIGKKEISWIPLFGWLFKLSGGILIDRKNKMRAISQIDDAVRAVRERQVSVGILPEGTRNRSGKGLLPFKKGAFHLATEAKVPLVPIIIAEFGSLANFKGKTLKSGTIQIKVLEPISTENIDSNQVTSLSVQIHDRMEAILPNLRSVETSS